ncbi:CDGSH iron-sulfur domain-containing protein [Patescibacteria group bacterium]|nr:CDGSH iron-sulfur domain-containing protein [Patescibacteria group bacterium]MCL5091272.1 CDGSH iron-sulfur domain-containing protein [Patescibacteria group bacterium]
MPRKVIKTAKQPFEVKPQSASVWICACGLSQHQPFCDGSHRLVQDEEDDKMYTYDAHGKRISATPLAEDHGCCGGGCGGHVGHHQPKSAQPRK